MVEIAAQGERSVGAGTIHGDVHTGDVRQVQLAPGVVQPPDDVRLPPTGIHNLPRRPVRSFVGRDDQLSRLHSLFEATGAQDVAVGGRGVIGQAIAGLGGVGKSELALGYADSRTGPGALVWWATAETGETLQLALAALTFRLHPVANSMGWTTAQAADWAVGWLQAHAGWLLVLDNVDDPALILPLLGQLSHGDVLVTTRRDIDWEAQGLTLVRLDVLDRAAAVDLLRAHTYQAEAEFDQAIAEELARELGDLPLALQQTAAYIRAHRISMATYLQRLRDETGATLASTAPGGDPQRAVPRVFALTVEALQTTAPTAVAVLRVLAWLAPDNIPRDIVVLTESDGQTGSIGLIDEMLGLLASYSLITLTPARINIHRLLQACLRTRQQEQGSEIVPVGLQVAVRWLAAAVPPGNPSLDTDTWARWRDLLPHLEAIFDYMNDNRATVDIAGLLGQTGFYLWVQGQHVRALNLEERALAVTEAALGPNHLNTAIRLDNLAATLAALDRHAEALPLRQRALAITESTLGPNHSETAGSLNNLAYTLDRLDRCVEALPLQQRALAITESTLGPNHPSTATVLNNLAHTLGLLGRRVEALPLQQRALAITESTLGPNHPDIATRLNNLAHTLAVLGRRVEALPLQQRALAITESTLGHDHPRTLIVRGQLDFLLQQDLDG